MLDVFPRKTGVKPPVPRIAVLNYPFENSRMITCFVCCKGIPRATILSGPLEYIEVPIFCSIPTYLSMQRIPD